MALQRNLAESHQVSIPEVTRQVEVHLIFMFCGQATSKGFKSAERHKAQTHPHQLSLSQQPESRKLGSNSVSLCWALQSSYACSQPLAQPIA